MALGGVLGGIFCALLAPSLFDWTYEHPLLILGAALLVPQRPLLPLLYRFWSADRHWVAFAIPAAALVISVAVNGPLALVEGKLAGVGSLVITMLALVSIGKRPVFAVCLAALMLSYGGWWSLDVSARWETRTRSYFGIYTISSSLDGKATVLTSGTTLHGLQNRSPRLRLEPTTYYTSQSGVGLAMRSTETLFGPDARIGVVGLGTGTLACYALPGQQWRFFEIDPAMVGIATRSGHFTFVQSCTPRARIEIGDARLSLSRAPRAGLDLLALDAFSSDVVPVHLLTREAFAVYGRALQPAGLLLVHISNRYIDLEPVVAAAAAEGWHGMVLDRFPMPLDMAPGESA
jgi:hypothetical protein